MTYDLQTTDAELMEARNWIIEVSIKRYVFHGKTPEEACAIVRAALDAPWPPCTIFDKPTTCFPEQSNLSPAEME